MVLIPSFDVLIHKTILRGFQLEPTNTYSGHETFTKEGSHYSVIRQLSERWQGLIDGQTTLAAPVMHIVLATQLCQSIDLWHFLTFSTKFAD
jgi:hypothetical protein